MYLYNTCSICADTSSVHVFVAFCVCCMQCALSFLYILLATIKFSNKPHTQNAHTKKNERNEKSKTEIKSKATVKNLPFLPSFFISLYAFSIFFTGMFQAISRISIPHKKETNFPFIHFTKRMYHTQMRAKQNSCAQTFYERKKQKKNHTQMYVRGADGKSDLSRLLAKLHNHSYIEKKTSNNMRNDDNDRSFGIKKDALKTCAVRSVR